MLFEQSALALPVLPGTLPSANSTQLVTTVLQVRLMRTSVLLICAASVASVAGSLRTPMLLAVA